MPNYKKLSPQLQERILEDRKNHTDKRFAFPDEGVIRRENKDKANLWRPAFVRDSEKIMNVPYYNRYSDKTQVFSFRKNDDISRRAYHVQLVSRIARNIGGVLGLNCDLIEAIALGHDIGHTPFGHEGERQLNALFHDRTGKYFNHNVHSVRVLDRMLHWNISLQTLDGILCHNGEMEQQNYVPGKLTDFDEFDRKVDNCIENEKNIARLVPCTLEGCVVRISDIIAYLGKDRQDAVKLGMLADTDIFTDTDIGSNNSEIINNLVVNIIENSYGKPALSMDANVFEMLVKAKKENSSIIYKNSDVENQYQTAVKPLMEDLYDRLLKDAQERNKESIIYRHHVNYVQDCNKYYKKANGEAYSYEDTEPNQMVVDYIASMTDDYFVDVCEHLLGSGHRIHYVGYFDGE